MTTACRIAVCRETAYPPAMSDPRPTERSASMALRDWGQHGFLSAKRYALAKWKLGVREISVRPGRPVSKTTSFQQRVLRTRGSGQASPLAP
jgi:hypothetical protein